jgi:ribonuclease-3
MLQERLQAESRPAPQYEVVETSGPPHRRTFHVEASWDSGRVRAEGRSIKVAETIAAKRALQQLDAEAVAKDLPPIADTQNSVEPAPVNT